MELTVSIRHEADGYWSELSELPGCFASARTLDELGEAIGLYLWDQPTSLGEQLLHTGEVRIQVEPLLPAGAPTGP